MKVKLLVPRIGPDGSQEVGDVIDVSAETAKRMMEAAPPQCVPVRQTKKKAAKEKAAK